MYFKISANQGYSSSWLALADFMSLKTWAYDLFYLIMPPIVQWDTKDRICWKEIAWPKWVRCLSDCVVVPRLGPSREEEGSFNLVFSNLKLCESLSVYALNTFPRCDSRALTLVPPSGFQNPAFQVSQISLSPQISLSSQKPHDQAEEFLWCYGWSMNPGKSLSSVSQLSDLGTVLAMSSVPPQLTTQFPTVLISTWIFCGTCPASERPDPLLLVCLLPAQFS